MDPSAVADELARRSARGERMPGAIIPFHTLGYPADVGRILAVADAHGIPVIEDAANAIGAGGTPDHSSARWQEPPA